MQLLESCELLRLCEPTIRQDQMERRDSPECKKRSAAEATDVLFH